MQKNIIPLTYLDEVHSVGIYGEDGKGIAVEMGVDQDIDIINGTLAKGIWSNGGLCGVKQNYY